MVRKKILRKFVDLSHCGIMCFWCSLFFVPSTWWPDKLSFHFFFTLTMFGHQFVWGGLVKIKTGKFRPTRILTTISQRLQGWSVGAPENFNHSFAQRIFERIGFSVSRRFITILSFSLFALVTVRYFFFNN